MHDDYFQNEFQRPWSHLEMAPADPLFGITEMYNFDQNPKKVLLGAGVYRDDQGKPYVLDCVKKAESRLLDADHEYSGIDGIPTFRQKSIELAYGADSEAVRSNRIASC